MKQNVYICKVLLMGKTIQIYELKLVNRYKWG